MGPIPRLFQGGNFNKNSHQKKFFKKTIESIVSFNIFLWKSLFYIAQFQNEKKAEQYTKFYVNIRFFNVL
jgi:hypothetical protein